MSSDSVIVLDQVSKLYYKQGKRTLKELLPAVFTGQRAGNWFWALQDLSFAVKRGESVGILGANGSGKSTLMKLIAGVSEPTKGKIKVKGQVAPLIELGAGFHPELTGRENVYLNGTILGMSRRDINRKFEEIVDFAEIWDFIDQPIKHYSSGMFLRLAFGVAVNVEADILLIDEVLAVGDQAFREKCYSRLRSLQAAGTTILLVSHSMVDVQKFCHSAILLKEGRLLASGSVKEVIDRYQSEL